MQLRGSDRTKREHAFHHNHDELITVDDLWEAWFASEERSWTSTDMVNWLGNAVRLPQYTPVFVGMEIDGRALPRSAYCEYSLTFSDKRHSSVHYHYHNTKATLISLHQKHASVRNLLILFFE